MCFLSTLSFQKTDQSLAAELKEVLILKGSYDFEIRRLYEGFKVIGMIWNKQNNIEKYFLARENL